MTTDILKCIPAFSWVIGKPHALIIDVLYPSDLKLNKANNSDIEATFLDLHLSIKDGIVCTKIYDKHDDFDFDIVNFPFLDCDVPCSPSYDVYISQIISSSEPLAQDELIIWQGKSL